MEKPAGRKAFYKSSIEAGKHYLINIFSIFKVSCCQNDVKMSSTANMKKCSLTREVHHSLMGGSSTPFKKEFMEIFTARCQNGFVCTKLISFN